MSQLRARAQELLEIAEALAEVSESGGDGAGGNAGATAPQRDASTAGVQAPPPAASMDAARQKEVDGAGAVAAAAAPPYVDEADVAALQEGMAATHIVSRGSLGQRWRRWLTRALSAFCFTTLAAVP